MGWFNGGSSKDVKGKKGRKEKGGSLSSVKDVNQEKVAELGAERDLFQYDRPTQEFGMSDLIKDHEEGSTFLYASLTGKEEESMESRLRRLVAYKANVSKVSKTLDNLPVISLHRETEIFPLAPLVDKKGKSYVRVADAKVLYAAVVSPNCNFTHVTVGIMDGRLLTNNMVKKFRATTNLPALGNLRLPYCVPVKDSNQLSLAVSRDHAFLGEGFQWGAIQIEVQLQYFDIPQSFDDEDVVAINRVTRTLLEDRKRDPDFVDISITNADRKKLQELYLQGDLRDETEPNTDKTGMTRYAKSTIASGSKGKKVVSATPEWSFMDQKRVGLIPADQISVDPSEDGDDGQPETWERPPTPPRQSKSPETSPPVKKVMFNDDRITPW